MATVIPATRSNRNFVKEYLQLHQPSYILLTQPLGNRQDFVQTMYKLRSRFLRDQSVLEHKPSADHSEDFGALMYHQLKFPSQGNPTHETNFTQLPNIPDCSFVSIDRVNDRRYLINEGKTMKNVFWNKRKNSREKIWESFLNCRFLVFLEHGYFLFLAIACANVFHLLASFSSAMNSQTGF